MPANRATLAALAFAAPLAACGGTAGEVPPVLALAEVASPASPGSAEPNLFAAADGHVYLSWLEPEGDGVHALRLQRLDRAGGAWSAAWPEPRTVARGPNFFVNWADFPSVVSLPDGTLAAHWLVRSGPGTYAYDVWIATSHDDGTTWSEPVRPHSDGTQTEHGFVSLFPWPAGGLGAVWLDGRKFAEAEAAEAAGHGNPTREMTVRHAVLDAHGQPGPETLLDGRACDCCQTAAALTAHGPVVVYRDRSPEEVRDISIVRHVAGRWTEPAPVHEDGWVIPACPVNGPSVAAAERRVAVAWFTAARDSQRVMLAFSEDAGAAFAAPVRVDDGDPAGRVAVQLLPGGAALVAWLERVGDGAEVRVRRVSADGRPGPATTVARSSAERASGFPRMVLSGDDVVFAWTEPGRPSHVRVAAGSLPGR